MSKLLRDFCNVGTMRLIARALMGVRGLFIAVTLSPKDLVQYTALLLVVFYFSFLDFGILLMLERDLPHHAAKGNFDSYEILSSSAWMTFFILSFASTCLMTILVGATIAKDNFYLALMLGLYFLTDKVNRAFESNSKIGLRYQETGIALLILALVSLLLIWILLPRFGIMGVFLGSVIASVMSTSFLAAKKPLRFSWSIQWNTFFRHIQRALPLFAIFYSFEAFRFTPMTAIMMRYSADQIAPCIFAFRIVLLCFPFFPFLLQDMMKTRMFQQIAKDKTADRQLEFLVFPIKLYALASSLFCLALYWFIPWFIGRLAPVYHDSATGIAILSLTLLPLGIAQVCSDFLSSRLYQQTSFVFFAWLTGIVLQVILLIAMPSNAFVINRLVPFIYLGVTFLIYLFISCFVFGRVSNLRLRFMPLFVLAPLFILIIEVFVFAKWFRITPSPLLLPNVFFFLLSSFIFLIVWTLIHLADRNKRYITFSLSPVSFSRTVN